MRFLDPSFLWFLPLALLPLLLNFIFPLKPFKLPFSSVILLRAVSDVRRKKITAAKTLILLLRCLAILALVGAFSRPVSVWSFFGAFSGLTAGSVRPVSLVVLADRSLSMSAAFAGRARLDFAAAAGARILGTLGARDEAALVFFDSAADSGGWTSDLSAVSEQLAAARPGFKGTDYRNALEKAYGLLASRSPSRRKAVLLLSDGAHNGFASMPGSLTGLSGYDPAVTLAGLVFPSGPNAWVSGVGALESGGRARLSVLTGSSGGFPVKEPLTGLYAPVFSGSQKAGPGGAVFPLPAGGDLSGRAELLTPDALARDNAVFFSLARKETGSRKALVLYTGPEELKPGGGAYFLKKFFETEAGAGGAFSADFLELSGLERPPGQDYGALIIFDGPVPARQAGLILRFVKSGGGAFIIAGAPVKASAERAVLSGLGFKAGETFEREFFLGLPEPAGGFEGVEFSGFELGRISVARAAAFEAPQGFEALWNFRDPSSFAPAFSSGAAHPALFGGVSGRGRVLVWTSSFSLPGTNLASKPVFAPFMAAVLRRLYGVRPPKLLQARIGGVYEGALENTDNVKVEITSPSGAKSYVQARNGVFKYTLTDAPGLYLWSAPPESGTFAVNQDAGNGESSLEAERFPPWLQLPGGAPVEAFKSALYGVEIGQFLLLLALVLFLAEFLLSRRAL